MRLVQYQKPFRALFWDGSDPALREARAEAAAIGWSVKKILAPGASFAEGGLFLSRAPWSFSCLLGDWMIFPAEQSGLPFVLSDADFAAQFQPAPGAAALSWHWRGDRRTCDACGGEVLVFKEGEICSGCKAAADPAPAAAT